MLKTVFLKIESIPYNNYIILLRIIFFIAHITILILFLKYHLKLTKILHRLIIIFSYIYSIIIIFIELSLCEYDYMFELGSLEIITILLIIRTINGICLIELLFIFLFSFLGILIITIILNKISIWLILFLLFSCLILLIEFCIQKISLINNFNKNNLKEKKIWNQKNLKTFLIPNHVYNFLITIFKIFFFY